MIDRLLLPTLARMLRAPAQVLVARGVGADLVTVAGFAIGLLALPLIVAGWTYLALAFILANRLADGLDGAVARLTTPSDRGAFLDIALDFVFYASVPLAFALADPAQNALPAATLIFAFVGTMSSFLAFSTIACKRGMTSDQYPTKGIYYLGGLTEGTETLVNFAAMCLWPASFPTIALIFAAACAITTATRWHMGWRAFGGPV